MVTAGSPAALAGIRKGDRIIAINGKPVSDRGCAEQGMEGLPGAQRLKVVRGEAEFEVEVRPEVVVR
jgi:C-terminal processing protease CtpA/Prc